MLYLPPGTIFLFSPSYPSFVIPPSSGSPPWPLHRMPEAFSVNGFSYFISCFWPMWLFSSIRLFVPERLYCIPKLPNKPVTCLKVRFGFESWVNYFPSSWQHNHHRMWLVVFFLNGFIITFLFVFWLYQWYIVIVKNPKTTQYYKQNVKVTWIPPSWCKHH